MNLEISEEELDTLLLCFSLVKGLKIKEDESRINAMFEKLSEESYQLCLEKFFKRSRFLDNKKQTSKKKHQKSSKNIDNKN